MKVNELRAKTKDMKKDELQQLIVEMYKQIPKKMREEKELDRLIDNPGFFKQERKRMKQTVKMPGFASVEYETKTFIRNAWAQNYFAPNRIVSKKERSNWRFTAKRLVEQIMILANQPEHGMACIHLLEDLYRLFCYASGHYVFASQEPFDTIKIPQETFLKRLILLKKVEQVPEKWISDTLTLIVKNDVGYNTLKSTLLDTMVSTLSNAPLKEKAVQLAVELLYDQKVKIRNTKKRSIQAEYAAENNVETLVEMVFMLQSDLGEYDEAIAFYKKHYIQLTDEVKVYILLEWILEYQRRTKEWMQEYELAVKRGIELRGALKKTYAYVKREGELPERMITF